MEIKGKVHCFFEQSGTFKREFIKLGIPAEDVIVASTGVIGQPLDITPIAAGIPALVDSLSADGGAVTESSTNLLVNARNVWLISNGNLVVVIHCRNPFFCDLTAHLLRCH